MVQGNTVRAKHTDHDSMAGLKSIFGGELSLYLIVHVTINNSNPYANHEQGF